MTQNELRLRVFDVDVLITLGNAFSDDDVKAVASSWSRCLQDTAVVDLPGDAGADSDAPTPSPAYVATVRRADGEGESTTVSGLTLEAVCESLVSTVTLTAISAKVGQNIMLHAAAVADPGTKRAIGLVAPSGTGKTTAAVTLGKSLSYLTDETLFLEKDLTVVPYPKPLSVIDDGSNPKNQYSPDDLGLVQTVTGSKLSVLAVLNRVDEVSAPSGVQVEQLDIVAAIHRLVPEMSGAPSLPEAFSQIVRMINTVNGVLLLTYADAARLEPVIRDLLDDAPESLFGTRADYLGTYPTVADPSQTYAETVYLRSAVKDAAIINDTLLVLIEGRLLEVSDLGQTVWMYLNKPRTEASILEEVVDVHGEHPEAPRLIREALELMEAQGLVEARRPHTAAV